MPSRNRGAAIQELRAPLQDIIDCVTKVIVIQKGDSNSDLPLSLELSQNPVRLPGPLDLHLFFRQRFRLVPVPDRRDLLVPRTVEYWFAVSNRAGEELFAYHWHPLGQSHVTFPHLHFGHDLAGIPSELTDAHFPTGPVTLAQAVRLLIADFSVRPRRTDWPSILDRAQARAAALSS